MKKSPNNGARVLRAPGAGRHPGCNSVQWRVYWVVGETPATEVRMFCSGARVLTVIQVAVLVGGSIIELLVKNTNNGGKMVSLSPMKRNGTTSRWRNAKARRGVAKK